MGKMDGPMGIHEQFVAVTPEGNLTPNIDHTRPRDLAPHPVEVIDKNFRTVQDRLDATTQAEVYGMAFPVTIRLQEAIVGSVARAPHLPSSNLGLEILRGEDEDLTPEDMLQDPDMSVRHTDPHFAMEAKLGIQMPQML